jgi:hypothetical protein
MVRYLDARSAPVRFLASRFPCEQRVENELSRKSPRWITFKFVIVNTYPFASYTPHRRDCQFAAALESGMSSFVSALARRLGASRSVTFDGGISWKP